MNCPEWDLTLWVRTLTGAERDDFENMVSSAGSGGKSMDLRGLKVRLVQLTTVTEDGEQVFDAVDQVVLNGKSSRVIDRLFQVSQRLSGLTSEDVEEMVGNSETVPVAASGSA